VEDTEDPEPEPQQTRKRKRRVGPALKSRPLLHALCEGLWQSKSFERFNRKRLRPSQGKACDWKGDETSAAASSLHIHSEAIADLSESIAEMVFKLNGFDLTGKRPWLAFGFVIGVRPWRYYVAIDPGLVLVGEYLVTSYEAKHARVVILPLRRLCHLVDIHPYPEPPPPPTQDEPS
jgi:hypothetical protein